jgi:hypothetical protein
MAAHHTSEPLSHIRQPNLSYTDCGGRDWVKGGGVMKSLSSPGSRRGWYLQSKVRQHIAKFSSKVKQHIAAHHTSEPLSHIRQPNLSYTDCGGRDCAQCYKCLKLLGYRNLTAILHYFCQMHATAMPKRHSFQPGHAELCKVHI